MAGLPQPVHRGTLFLQLLPAGLSALVLAAHFLRAGNLILLWAGLSILALMFVRRFWAARLIQLALVLGTVEWVRTLIVLILLRRQSGQPVARLAIILGTGAPITAASALVFRTRTLRQHFRLSVSLDDHPADTAGL